MTARQRPDRRRRPRGQPLRRGPPSGGLRRRDRPRGRRGPPPVRASGALEGVPGRPRATRSALRPDGFWREKGIDLRVGTRIHRIDFRRRIARTDADSIRWDALVLATGARPRRIASLDGRRGVHVLRTLDDARALGTDLGAGRRLAIVGAGFVGAEVASTAVEVGSDVSLIEAGTSPFGRILGDEVGRVLADRYRAAGVDLRTGAMVQELRMDAAERLRGLALADGAETACDAVLVAVGAEPATELLGGGVVETDACGRTALPGVYACGDVAAVVAPAGRSARANRALDERGVARHGGCPRDPRPERAGGRRAVLLVGPVRAPAPARRTRRELGQRRAGGEPATRSLRATTRGTARSSPPCSPTARARRPPCGASWPSVRSPPSR